MTQQHVLVTGAGGYIGTRLVPELLRRGHRVRATFSTGTPRPDLWWTRERAWADRLEVVGMDAADPAQVEAAVQGVDSVFYLIHAMGGTDFAERDREWATTVGKAAGAAGVGRIVYLSGLVPPVDERALSRHITSRLEVERILGEHDVPAITLRAAIVIGSGSTSFELVRQLSERLPVRGVPTWLRSQVQPIAVVDVIEALASSLDAPARTRFYDVGGPDRLAYPRLMSTYAELARIVRPYVPLPVAPTRLVGFFAGRIASVSTSTAEALVESLHHDMVCGETYDDFVRDLLPPAHRLVDVRTAVARSLERPRAGVRAADRDPMGPLPGDPPFAGGGIHTFDGRARRHGTLRNRVLLGPLRPRWFRNLHLL
jgi:uncharacterized protein YbjT (DUF2867 family)